MAITYEPISTTTLGSAAATVTFSTISGAYTDLILVAEYTVSGGGDHLVRFNSDTGSNYSVTVLAGTGSATGSGRSSSQTSYNPNWNSDQPSQRIIITHQIQNYSNSTTYKTLLTRLNNASSQTVASVGLWRSTSAITSIDLLRSAGNYNSGSTFTLYGIKAA
jgi:hypothetical protein